MARFVVAASSLVIILGSACGPTTTRPDAGSSVGGGVSGTGGGTASTGGGSAGGGSATGGGSAGGSASSDGGLGCIQFPSPLNYMGMAGSGSYELLNDGGTGQHYAGVVTGPSAAGPFTTVDVAFLNEQPQTPLTFPVTGTFESINNATVVYPVSFFGTNCMNDGSQCQQAYLSVSGNYNITAATPSIDAGTFVGSLTTVRYRQVDPNTFRPVMDGGCVDLAAFNFNTRWP